MPHALLNLSVNASRTLDVIKAKYRLKDKSAAVEVLVDKYIDDANDPELRPEFLEELKRIAREPGIRVDDFAARYGLKHVRARRQTNSRQNLLKARQKKS